MAHLVPMYEPCATREVGSARRVSTASVGQVCVCVGDAETSVRVRWRCREANCVGWRRSEAIRCVGGAAYLVGRYEGAHASKHEKESGEDAGGNDGRWQLGKLLGVLAQHADHVLVELPGVLDESRVRGRHEGVEDGLGARGVEREVLAAAIARSDASRAFEMRLGQRA